MPLWHLGELQAIGGLSVETLADRFGTPLFVYDADLLDDRVGLLEEAIPHRPLRVFYSVKANPSVAVLLRLTEAGAGVDACSTADLLAARHASVPAARISFCGFGLSEPEVEAAFAQAGTVVLDSLPEIELAATVAPGGRVGLRLNLGITAGFHPSVQAGAPGSKFGIALDELDDVLGAVARLGLEVDGLHSHVGSNVLEPEPHLLTLQGLLHAANRVPGLSWINLGGGWGTPRDPPDEPYDWRGFGQRASELIAASSRPDLELRIEPGAWMTMESGYLLTRVNLVKSPGCRRPRIAVVDASGNLIPSLGLYESRHRCWTARAGPRTEPESMQVAGRLMQAGDILDDDWQGPRLEPRDLVVIGDVGAYAASRSTNFNGLPRPAEILLSGGEAKLIRQAENIEELFEKEMI